MLCLLLFGICLPKQVRAQLDGYSLIQKKYFYVGFSEEITLLNYVNCYDLLHSSNSFFTRLTVRIKSDNYEFPFCWDIYYDTLFSIASRQTREFRKRVYFFQTKLSKLSQDEIFKQDSIGSAALEKEYPELESRLDVVGDRLMKKEIESNFRRVIPITSSFSELEGIYAEMNEQPLKNKDIITYDFVTLNRDTHLFFVRDDRKLSVWKYAYPVIGQKNEDSDWQEVITYTSDSTYIPPEKSFYYKPNYAFHASKEKTVCSAIDDTLFFKGHFKAVQQDGETYLINLKHGAIYHLQEKKIVRIGELDIGNQKFSLAEGQTFIEDRDNRRLIFFGKVAQVGRPEKFPSFIEILTKEDLRMVFPNIYEIFIPVDQH